MRGRVLAGAVLAVGVSLAALGSAAPAVAGGAVGGAVPTIVRAAAGAGGLSVIRTIPVGSKPGSVEFSPDGTFAYVVDNGSNEVTRIATADGSTSSIPVGIAPSRVAFSPDGSIAYVSNYSGTSVTKINTADNTTSTIPLATGAGPTGVAFSPDGTYAYLSQYGGRLGLVKIATSTGTVTPVNALRTYGVAFAPDGSSAWVALPESNAVAKVNTVNGTYATTPVGASPYVLALSPDGSQVYVANGGGTSVTKIPAAGGASTSITVGAQPNDIAASPDGNFVYTANTSGSVTQVSTADDSTTTIPLGTKPAGIAVSPDSTRVYVTDNNAGTVSVIAAGTSQVSDVVVDHSTSPVSLSGVGVAGGTVTAKSSSGVDLGVATVDASGNWTFQLTGAPDADGVVNLVQTVDGVDSDPFPVDVSLTVPMLTAPTVDTSTAPPTLSGTALAGALVTVTDSAGNVIGETTADGSGAWSLPLSGFPQSDRVVNLVQTVDGSSSEPLTTTIPVVVPAPGNPVVDSSTTPPTLSGSGGVPGATIVVTGSDGTPYGQATVDAEGNWSVQLSAEPADGNVQLVQSVNGIDSQPNDVNLADAPAIDPMVGTGAAVAVAGVGTALLLFYRRRRLAQS